MPLLLFTVFFSNNFWIFGGSKIFFILALHLISESCTKRLNDYVYSLLFSMLLSTLFGSSVCFGFDSKIIILFTNDFFLSARWVLNPKGLFISKSWLLSIKKYYEWSCQCWLRLLIGMWCCGRLLLLGISGSLVNTVSVCLTLAGVFEFTTSIFTGFDSIEFSIESGSIS